MRRWSQMGLISLLILACSESKKDNLPNDQIASDDASRDLVALSLDSMKKNNLADYEIQEHCQALVDFVDYFLSTYTPELDAKQDYATCYQHSADVSVSYTVHKDDQWIDLGIEGQLESTPKENRLHPNFRIKINVEEALTFNQELQNIVPTFQKFIEKPLDESTILGRTQVEYAVQILNTLKTRKFPIGFIFYDDFEKIQLGVVTTSLEAVPGSDPRAGTVVFPNDIEIPMPAQPNEPERSVGMFGCQNASCLNDPGRPVEYQIIGPVFIMTKGLEQPNRRELMHREAWTIEL